MSIFPATDIVADVARAVDPRKAQAAAARLSAIAAEKSASPAATAFSIETTPAHPPRRGTATPIEQPGSAAPRIATLGAAGKFEAYLLQNWLEALLPKESSGAFGADSSATVWRSMMAEQLGTQLASAGGIGLQKLLDQRSDAGSRSWADHP